MVSTFLCAHWCMIDYRRAISISTRAKIPWGSNCQRMEWWRDSPQFIDPYRQHQSRLLSKTMASTPAFANALTRSLRSSARTLTAAATRRLLLTSSHRILETSFPTNSHRKLQLLHLSRNTKYQKSPTKIHHKWKVLRGSREIVIFDEILFAPTGQQSHLQRAKVSLPVFPKTD